MLPLSGDPRGSNVRGRMAGFRLCNCVEIIAKKTPTVISASTLLTRNSQNIGPKIPKMILKTPSK